MAIVVPDDGVLRKFSEEQNLVPQNTSLELLIENQSVLTAVHAEMITVGKRSGLSNAELIQGLVLVSEEWTPENVRHCLID